MDWEKFEGEAEASHDILGKITEAASKARDLEDAISSTEDFLKTQKSGLNHLKQVVLPDFMAQAQLGDFTLEDGFKVAIKDFVSGSINKAEGGPEAGMEYLSSIGGEPLIKTSVSIDFGKNEHNIAAALKDVIENFLKENGFENEVTLSSTVHAQSLIGFAGEKIKNGEEFNAEKLGLYVGRIAKTSRGKPKKAKTK